MDPYHSLYLLLLAVVLVALNAFFVVSEFAIVKVRKTKLEEIVKTKNSKNAKLALRMSNNLDTYLSATQLGITLASLALGWIGEPALYELIIRPIAFIFYVDDGVLLHTISFAVAFSIITLMHVVLGEIVPKSIAIAKSEEMVLLIARPLHMFWLMFYPFIYFFDRLAAFCLKILKIDMAKANDLAHSDEELKIIVGESLKGGLIDSVEGEIIKNAVDFSDTVAKEIMTPRKDIVCLNVEDSFDQNLEVVLNSHFTRYPYCKNGKDNIIGMIHLRDILQIVIENKPHNLSSIVREMIIVPENASISNILKKMNKEQMHTALVIDEYGGTAGMLTMEDIIEEVMGDISDEYDAKTEDFNKIDSSTFEFDGKYEMFEAKKVMNVEFADDSDSVTIGGYVFNLFEKLPNVGDKIIENNLEFEVLELENKSIKKVKVKILDGLEEF